MTRLLRWLLAITLGVTAACVLPAAPGAAIGRRDDVLDGVQLRYLPPGLGGYTDFAYDDEDVSFAARAWESGSDEAGWRVDLDVEVLRGGRLSGARALHDWFIAYEQRPAGEVHYRPIRVHGHRGWVTRDEVFWLVRPGLAIAVTVDGARYSQRVLLRTARRAVVR